MDQAIEGLCRCLKARRSIGSSTKCAKSSRSCAASTSRTCSSSRRISSFLMYGCTVPQCHRWMVAHWRIASGGCGTMQHYSFYDLIVTKARGKSGPLFNWDVHDDVRVLSDARKEKDEVRGIYPPWLCAACDCEADVEPPWRCRSRTLPRSWSDDGMSATSTSSRPVDGRSSTRQSSAIDTRSTVIEQAVVDTRLGRSSILGPSRIIPIPASNLFLPT